MKNISRNVSTLEIEAVVVLQYADTVSYIFVQMGNGFSCSKSMNLIFNEERLRA